MMGVYIPNIKIPEKCSKCRNTGLKFAIDELGLKCPERKEIFGPTEADIKGIRRPDCPLVSVKEPHGRLGDLDKLEQMFADIDHAPYSGFDGEDPFYSAADAAQIIRLTPTIIPAEEAQP